VTSSIRDGDAQQMLRVVLGFFTPSDRRSASSAERIADMLEKMVHAPTTQRRPKALVVDDNQVNQLLATAMLDRLGFEVETCDDGRHAIEACRRDAPDFVLMDVLMPEMDGMETSRRLRALQHDGVLPRFPIVAASASGIGALPGDCIAAGMDAFLDKPMSISALAAVAQRLTVSVSG